MDGRAIFDAVAAACGDAARDFNDGHDASFKVVPDRLIEVARFLRDDPALRFDFLQNLTAVDWAKQDVLQSVYHLFSYTHRHEIALKVDAPRAHPRVPSVSALWNNANWLEREQYDLLGVVYEGHPDLRRLLMPDDWMGHPMRKDYREAAAYRGMPTTRPSPVDLLLIYDQAHEKPPEKPPAS